MNPAIVVCAYNRPQALARLLDSLRRAEFPRRGSIPLVISIDRATDQAEVIRIATGFTWRYGSKQIVLRPRHLGPVEHFLTCGELSQRYGSIIYLEDDLVVSPVFYAFAAQALDYFDGDERIGGISLYGLWFNGYTQEPFTPLVDDADHFFLQVPYTQGLAFSGKQWRRFREWSGTGQTGGEAAAPIHAAWDHFREDEWFPRLARYLIGANRTFVYPRTSLATGFGDAGTHFRNATAFFQTPLQLVKSAYRFKPLDQSLAVYDSFFELLPDRLCRIAPALRDHDFTVDLYATRRPANIRTDLVLTTRPCRRAVLTFGACMRPLEANLMHAVPGRGISLCRKADLRWDWPARFDIRKQRLEHLFQGRSPGMMGTAARLLLILGQILPRSKTR